MRRSSAVAAPLLASAAVALLSGCHNPEMQRCVDANNRVVDPSFCKDLPASNGQSLSGANAGVTGHAYGGGGFHYYYGGSGGYDVGSVARGGSTAPAVGHSYSTTTGTARGGFGSSFGSGERGGHGGGGE